MTNRIGQGSEAGGEGPNHPSGGTIEEASGVTVRQAGWALLFVVLYLAAFVGGVIAVGLSGLVDVTIESMILVVLVGATSAAMLALYVHLIRKHRLSLSDLGFRRFRPRMFHLLWQIPAAIVIAAIIQGLVLIVVGLLGFDNSSMSASNETIADIARLPRPLLVLALVVIAVLTPLWEEVLFRGAFLSGFSRRYKPWLADVLSAALFAAVHLVLPTFAYLFALGVALALLRRFHQNLWAPVLLHATNNALVVLIVLTAL